MNKPLLTSLLAAGVLLAYLAFWPVPIDPVAWEAPADRGLVDPFAPNKAISAARGIPLGDQEGPEDAAFGPGGNVYVTTRSGTLLQLSRSGRARPFAELGGRPLGIARAPDGGLIVANAYIGIQRVDAGGNVKTLLEDIEGVPLVYANNVAVASDGRIYFSESSTKFGAQQYAGTYESSLLDIMEHGANGRLVAFDPDSGSTEVLLDGLHYANGVALSPDEDFLLVAETAEYRVIRLWLAGPRAGESEVLLDNLPGFPDNITTGLQDRFWIGFAAPRNALLDRLSGKPALRKVVQRLPSFLRPRAEPYSHVVAINAQGEVLMNLQDTTARYPTLTGALEAPDALYLTSLFGSYLPRLDKRDLL